MLTDSFLGDIKYIENLLLQKTPFSLTRYGDGERYIMEGRPTDNGEFRFTAEQTNFKDDLLKSLQLRKDHYIVGIPCPCCQPQEKCNYMKKLSTKPDSELTWSNIFVNSNFAYFKNNIVGSFAKYDYVYFAGRGNPENIPFKIHKFYKTSTSSHVTDVDLVDEISNEIHSKNINKGLFLFAAGPFAKILCYKLYSRHNNNTFIDLGSVLDVHQGLGSTRGYLSGSPRLNQTCIWEKEL